MLYRPLANEHRPTPSSVDPLLQSLTPCDNGALQRLTNAFNETKPAAILIGDSHTRSGCVIDNFVADIDDTASVIRITSPCSDATSCMQAVVCSIGFESNNFSLADLEKIFTMFLCHQRTHGLRTVLCFESAQDCDLWVINKISELTELEAREKFGLFVILSGRREMKQLQRQIPMRRVAAHAGRHIDILPLQLDETRELVLQQVQPEGSEDVGEIIQFDAITRLHEIGEGVADTVSGLCIRSLQLAEQDSSYPITANTISRAALALGLDSEKSSQVATEFLDAGVSSHGFGRLIFKLGDNAYGERTLDCASECVSIGRDRNNNVCIPSRLVSRHHVLIAASSTGVKLMDLGSTNGTYVNGDKAHTHILKNGDEIRLGDCQMEYASAEQGEPRALVDWHDTARTTLG